MRNKFTEFASRWHILHRDRDFGLPLRQFVECDLSARLDIAAITAIPGDALLWLKRGRLGIPLHIFSKRAFHHPVARTLARLGNRFDVGHKARELLEIGPDSIYIVNIG